MQSIIKLHDQNYRPLKRKRIYLESVQGVYPAQVTSLFIKSFKGKLRVLGIDRLRKITINKGREKKAAADVNEVKRQGFPVIRRHARHLTFPFIGAYKIWLWATKLFR